MKYLLKSVLFTIYQFSLAVLLALAIGYFFCQALENYYSLPVVYWSQSKNKCVFIEISGQKGKCANLPTKYTIIYVK